MRHLFRPLAKHPWVVTLCIATTIAGLVAAQLIMMHRYRLEVRWSPTGLMRLTPGGPEP